MTDQKARTMQVSAIVAGTVIDHINTKRVFDVAAILKLQDVEENVLIGINLDSRHGPGKKGIIKVGGRRLTQEEVSKIALIAPDATLNIIENYEVVKKLDVQVPDVIEGAIKCFNPNCVSNHQNIVNRFYVVKRDPLRIRCHYCERHMGLNDIQLL